MPRGHQLRPCVCEIAARLMTAPPAPLSSAPSKAVSVLPSGEPDGFLPPRCFRLEVFPDGHTRLVVSVPADELPAIHLAFVRVLGARLGVRYLQLTDRQRGQLPTPEGRVAMDVDAPQVIAALESRPELIYRDGRHQLWLRGGQGESMILDENGVIFVSPDDPSFREVLANAAIPESAAQTLEKRDYVRVNFSAAADVQEASLWAELNMLRWK